MKKLFLTSGLVLCMACPAFASQINYNEANESYALQGEGTLGCVTPDTLTSATAPTTFYAMWEARDDYIVRYLPGGAANTTPVRYAGTQTTVPAAGQSTYATYDATYTVLANTSAAMGAATLIDGQTHGQAYEKTGYTFAGWKSQYDLTDGTQTETTYQGLANQDLTYGVYDPESVDLVAQWTSNKAKIILDSKRYYTVNDTETSQNATSAGPADVWTRYEGAIYANNANAVAQSTPITTITVPTLTGYTFNGYYTQKGGEGTSYISNAGAIASNLNVLNEGSPIATAEADTASTTLYAHWTANQYTLTYNCGSYTSGNISYTTDNGGGIISAAANLMTKNYYFDAAGEQSVTPASLCSLEGYKPSAWICESEATVNSPANFVEGAVDYDTEVTTAKWSIPANVNCHVTWTPNEIELHWETGGGTNPNSEYYAAGQGTESCTYDLGINVGAAPTKPGYDFVGWTTNQNAQGVHQGTTPTQQGGGDNGGETPENVEP